ncbi:MAG TPA: hypothetical protein VFY18_06915, partial [Candidatus Limnocylindrales bacterium]|nr:hypothetical protein [Candidatus Limnocylindrales bacterium]
MEQRRPIIAGLAIAAVATLVVVLGGGLIGRPPGIPTASPSPSGPTSGVGPVVFYEIDDADGAKLMARTLDGRSLARVVASRTDLDAGRTWSVDPTGTIAIAATSPVVNGTRLEGVSL